LILVRRQSIFNVLKSMIRGAAPVSANLLSLLDDFCVGMIADYFQRDNFNCAAEH